MQGRLPFSGGAVLNDLGVAVGSLAQLLPREAHGPECSPEAAQASRGLVRGQEAPNGEGRKRCCIPGCATACPLCLPLPQATADFLRWTGVLPSLLACLRWLAHEARQEPAHLPAASLLALQHELLSLLGDIAGQGPACAALLAEAGAAAALQAVLEAPKVRAGC